MVASEGHISSMTHTPQKLDYIARFGLKREPFSDAVDDDFFFSESEEGERTSLSRIQRLNLLLHLAPYSDVLLVTGETGIGKTTLLHQFLARVDPSWRVCALSASSTVKPEVVYQCLMREFAREERTSANQPDDVEDLRKHIRALRESAKSPILLIDDAHELSDEVLLYVLRLVQTGKDGGKRLSVIMFSGADIEHTLAQSDLKPLRNLISHSFELTPLNEVDTGNYIKHRLAVAGMSSESPFTPAVVKVIHETSHGIPGKINELAQMVLKNSTSVELTSDVLTPPPQQSVFKRYGILGVIAAVVAVILLSMGQINSFFTAEHSTDTRQSMAEQQSGNAPLSEEASGAGGQTEHGTDMNRFGTASSTTIAQHTRGETGDDKPAAGTGEHTETITADSGNTPAHNLDEDSGAMIDDRDKRSLAMVEVVVTDSEKTVKVDSPTSDSPEPAATEQSREMPVKKQEKQNNTDVHNEKMIATQNSPGPGIHRETWLLQQDPQSFTLQLMAIREEATIIKFINDHNLQDQAAYFNTYNNNIEWLAVVYGIYPTREEAERASKQLQERIARLRPWIRSLKSVQESVHSYQTHQSGT